VNTITLMQEGNKKYDLSAELAGIPTSFGSSNFTVSFSLLNRKTALLSLSNSECFGHVLVHFSNHPSCLLMGHWNNTQPGQSPKRCSKIGV